MLNTETAGLIVVDVQGKLARMMDQSEQLIENIGKLIQGCQALGLPVLQLEQIPEKLGGTVPELAELLTQSDVIAKTTFSGCGEPEFLAAVQASGRKQWLVCGIETHICVYQTALGLHAAGYEVEVVTDCVGSRTAANKALGLAKMQRKGVELTSFEMAFYELMGDCRHPAFKGILPLVK